MKKIESFYLTKDRGILKYSQVKLGYCIRSIEADKQVIEVLDRYNLREQINLFQICSSCNGTLSRVKKNDVKDRIEEKIFLRYNDFFQCDHCSKVYWKGSHIDNLKAFLEKVVPGYG